MKKALIIISTLVLSITLLLYIFLDTIGGNFNGEPEEMKGNLSVGAKTLIKIAFHGLPEGETVDHHSHVVGMNHNHGTTVHPKMTDITDPVHYIKGSVYLSGAKVTDLEKSNEQYLERLVSLIKNIPNHGKYHILAFDHHYNKDGTVNHDKSEFYTSNEYIYSVYENHPDLFTPVISVHPYRKDAVDELNKWALKGVRWVKWLPNAHGIDASLERNDQYYETLKKHNMILLTHVGEEQAVEAEEDQKLGNPLLFRRPLDLGVTVVMAHAASLGEDEDFDSTTGNAKTKSFDLFMRMMDNPKYDGLLFADLSAITQINRLPEPLTTLLDRDDLHHRLLDGSDYPLPAINIVIHTRELENLGMITTEERGYLNEIYSYNPLLFDFVLKRTLKHPKTGKGFGAEVFTGINSPLREK